MANDKQAVKPMPFPGESPTVALAMAAGQKYGLHEEAEKPSKKAAPKRRSAAKKPAAPKRAAARKTSTRTSKAKRAKAKVDKAKPAKRSKAR